MPGRGYEAIPIALNVRYTGALLTPCVQLSDGLFSGETRPYHLPPGAGFVRAVSFLRIMFDVLPMVLAGVAIAFMPGAESAICPTGTVAVNVTSAEDVLILADALKCTGGGDFNVTWYSSLPLDQTIEVSDMKNMTITGSGSPVIYRGLGGDTFDSTFLDDGSGTALFSVSDGSTLSLINLVLKGGEAENGGAVDLLSSSSLYVHGCNFAQNNASDGGDTLCVSYHSIKLKKKPRRSL